MRLLQPSLNSFLSAIDFCGHFFEKLRCSYRRRPDISLSPILYRCEPPRLDDRRPDGGRRSSQLSSPPLASLRHGLHLLDHCSMVLRPVGRHALFIHLLRRRNVLLGMTHHHDLFVPSASSKPIPPPHPWPRPVCPILVSPCHLLAVSCVIAAASLASSRPFASEPARRGPFRSPFAAPNHRAGCAARSGV
jgi:hypothetical protein